jgi:hypothetical protein
MARLRCQSHQAKVNGHWPGGSSWQTGHFASAIWKFLLGFALAPPIPRRSLELPFYPAPE